MINNNEIETMQIDDGKGGYIVINKDQYDPEIHQPYKAPIEENKPEPKEESKDKAPLKKKK